MRVWRCEAEVSDLLVKSLEIRQVRCLAQCECIAKHSLNAHEPTRRKRVTFFLEGVSQMDSIPPGRLLALVRPGNDLVLRRIRNLKRCVQACGCNITTPRHACKMPRSQKPARKPARSQPEASQKPAHLFFDSQNSQKPEETQPEASQTQPEASQKPAKPRVSFEQKQRQRGILPNRVSRGRYVAATRLHAAFFRILRRTRSFPGRTSAKEPTRWNTPPSKERAWARPRWTGSGQRCCATT